MANHVLVIKPEDDIVSIRDSHSRWIIGPYIFLKYDVLQIHTRLKQELYVIVKKVEHRQREHRGNMLTKEKW